MTTLRNQVIEAGAGTGKTYSLVQAILQALFQHGIPFPAIVALTFTKKAAGEMKERVAQELHTILDAATVPEAYLSWGHGLDELKALAKTAFDQIDRANISTIHSFAFSLLKRFPLNAGINPESEVDEKGVRYADYFELEWPRFLARELRTDAPHEKEWLEILSRVSLADVEEAARLLSDFDAPLRSLPLSDEDLPSKLAETHDRIRAMIAGHPGSEKAGRVAAACEEVIGIGASSAWEKLAALSDETKELLRETANPTKAWSRFDIRQLKFFQKIALNVSGRGDHLVALLTERLKPFVTQFRTRVLAEGYLSNSALLALACDLVRRDHGVRSMLKREFRALFIDEFQDTDPLQGELLLFLAEKPEGHATRWREVELEPGKLFVVGDPKQSIYRFRGADIAAYREIIDKIINQSGDERQLQTSRRSHDQLIHVVNQAFAQIMVEKPRTSPAYVPLIPLRERDQKSLQDVIVQLSRSNEKRKAKDAAQQEAYVVAQWISEQVGKESIRHKTDGVRPLAYRDIALIFRSMPSMRPFVEALRAYGMPYVVEGERYFYSTPEVTDLVNFLRVLDNPHDALALVGFLRSPLGGFTDPEILDLKEAGRLDPTRPLPAGAPVHQQHIWDLLARLHARVGREPLKILLRDLFEESYVLELAARSYHHDQTVANLLKLKRLLESFAEEGVTTLRVLLEKVRSFMENDRLEGESPLADETYDAIRILTIHKAKGLEFPVVILPALHQGRDDKGRRRPETSVFYEWSSGRLGLRIAGLQNLDHLILDKENEERQYEEEKRVLYVAMTRAREFLFLSGAVNLSHPSSESYLEWLASAFGVNWAGSSPGRLPVGATDIGLHFIDSTPAPKIVARADKTQRALEALDPVNFAGFWHKREAQQAALCAQPLIDHPTDGKQPKREDRSAEETLEKATRPDRALLLGTLVHKFLEKWDFTCEKCSMPAMLREMANRYFAGIGLLREPFPDPRKADPVFKPGDPMQELLEVIQEAQSILADFLDSPASDEIKSSEILGREVPFFYQTTNKTLMRGTMDILYRTAGGELVVGDYKSGKTNNTEGYAAQSTTYLEAIHRSLGEKAQFKLIFLRSGELISQ